MHRAPLFPTTRQYCYICVVKQWQIATSTLHRKKNCRKVGPLHIIFEIGPIDLRKYCCRKHLDESYYKPAEMFFVYVTLVILLNILPDPKCFCATDNLAPSSSFFIGCSLVLLLFCYSLMYVLFLVSLPGLSSLPAAAHTAGGTQRGL